MHQAYCVYILPDLGLFVSIGEYFGSLVLVLAPLILRFLAYATTEEQKEEVQAAPAQEQPRGAQRRMARPRLALAAAAALIAAVACAPRAAIVLLPLPASAVTLAAPLLLASQIAIRAIAAAAAAGDEAQTERLWAAARALLAILITLAHLQVGMVDYPLALAGAVLLSPTYAAMHRPSSAPWRLALAILWAASAAAVLHALPALVADPRLWPDMRATGLLHGLKHMQRIYPQSLHLPYLLLVLLPAHSLSLAMIFA